MSLDSHLPEFGPEGLPVPIRPGSLGDELTSPQEFQKSVVRRLLHLSRVACEQQCAIPGITRISTTKFGDHAIGAIWHGGDGTRHIDIVFGSSASHTGDDPSHPHNWVQQWQDSSSESKSSAQWCSLDYPSSGPLQGQKPHVLAEFQQVYEIFAPHVLNWLRHEVNAHHDVVTLSGHFVGAAIATICAADLAAQSMPLRLVTFACPKVGDLRFRALLASLRIRIARFVCRCDPVTNLPHEHTGAVHVEDPTLIDAFVISSSLGDTHTDTLRFHTIDNYASRMENLFRPPLSVINELGFKFLPWSLPLLIRAVGAFGQCCLSDGSVSYRKITDLLQESAEETLQLIRKAQEGMCARLSHAMGQNDVGNQRVVQTRGIISKLRCVQQKIKDDFGRFGWVPAIHDAVVYACFLLRSLDTADQVYVASVRIVVTTCILELRLLAIHGLHSRLPGRVKEVQSLLRPLVECSRVLVGSSEVKEMESLLRVFSELTLTPFGHSGVALVSAKDRARHWLNSVDTAVRETKVQKLVDPSKIQHTMGALETMSMLVAFIGPDLSEKNSLVNALFASHVCPMHEPSFLPLAFIADSTAQHYAVVLKGDGLQDCLSDALQNTPLNGLALDELPPVIRKCNATLQDRITNGKLQIAAFHDFPSWCVHIVVPWMRRQTAAIVCPDPHLLAARNPTLHEATSLWLQFQVRRCGLVVVTIPCCNLNMLLERPRLLTLFGGPPPPKPALLTITGVRTSAEQHEAGEWLNRHPLTLGCLQIRRCLFVNGQVLLAHELFQCLSSRQVPELSCSRMTSQYSAYQEAIAVCGEEMGLPTSEDVCDRLPGMVERAYASSWSDNDQFFATIDAFSDSEFHDLFLHAVRQPVLRDLGSTLRRNEQEVLNKSFAIEEVLLRQAKIEAVMRRLPTMRRVVRRALCDGEDIATLRVRAAAETLGMEGVCVNTAERRANFETRLAGVVGLEVARTCMEALNLFWTGRALDCDVMSGLVFPSRAAAAPLARSFVTWAARVAHTECCVNVATTAAMAWLHVAFGCDHGISVKNSCSYPKRFEPQQRALEQAKQPTFDDSTFNALEALTNYHLVSLPVHSISSSLNLSFWPFVGLEDDCDLSASVSDDLTRFNGSLVDDFESVWSRADGQVVVFQKVHWCAMGLDTIGTVLESIVHEVATNIEKCLREALASVEACKKSWHCVAIDDRENVEALKTLLQSLE